VRCLPEQRETGVGHVVGGEAPIDTERFVNARAEDYWTLRERFEHCSSALTAPLSWPVDHRLSPLGSVAVARYGPAIALILGARFGAASPGCDDEALASRARGLSEGRDTPSEIAAAAWSDP
jgi:hypothetical protein